PSDGRGPASPAVTRDPDRAPRAPETAAYPEGGRAIMRRNGRIHEARGEGRTSWTTVARAAALAFALVLVAGAGARLARADDPPPTFTPISDDFKGDTL